MIAPITHDPPPPADSRAAFRYPDFRLYQASRFLGVVAIEMQSVAIGWQVYELTRRPLDLGLVGLVQFLPGILLFLLSGHAADRFPRRQIILCCLAGFALCSMLLFGLTLHGPASVRPIYLVLVLFGIVRAFYGPAGQAFLPLLVPQEHFPNAVAWSSSVFQAATILGPTMGGLIYGWTGGAHAVYAASAAALIAAALFILAMRLRSSQARQEPPTLDSLLAGFTYVWKTKILLGAVSLDLFAVLLGGAVALLPIYAREILHTGPWGLGLLRSAPGIGAILTAVALAHRPLGRRAGAAMLGCVGGFGVFTIVFGLSRSLPLSMAALFLAGACDMVSVVVRGTVVQLETPDRMRGRVSAINMVFIGASNELGQFESGLTAQAFGTVPAVVLGGLGTLAVVAAWTRLFPALRRVSLAPAPVKAVPEEPGLTADPAG
ncbi:MAG: MFS transporter [Elusimicrobia bacterium]|nr:MFS transporter [Elusimicrobiota bacterium]